jgi:hypothetical protein
MEVSCQLHAPAALPLGKEPRYPLDKKLCGPPWILMQENKSSAVTTQLYVSFMNWRSVVAYFKVSSRHSPGAPAQIRSRYLTNTSQSIQALVTCSVVACYCQLYTTWNCRKLVSRNRRRKLSRCVENPRDYDLRRTFHLSRGIDKGQNCIPREVHVFHERALVFKI